MVSDAKVNSRVAVVRVKLWSGRRKTQEKAMPAAGSVPGSLADFTDPADYMQVSDDDIVEEDAPWDLRDLTSIDDFEPSALLCMPILCLAHGLTVPSNVCAL